MTYGNNYLAFACIHTHTYTSHIHAYAHSYTHIDTHTSYRHTNISLACTHTHTHTCTHIGGGRKFSLGGLSVNIAREIFLTTPLEMKFEGSCTRR